MSPCQPAHQNSDAPDMAPAAVKAPMVEPELGSTSAAFEMEGADRVVVGETNRVVEGLGGLMRTVQLPQQVSANGPVGLSPRRRPLEPLRRSVLAVMVD
jgi:hypothetical protein